MTTKGPQILILAAMLTVLWTGVASADIYRFKDENGAWHFSNDKQLVTTDRRYKLYIKYRNNPTLYINDFTNEISAASKKYGVDASLIKAVIHAESAFNRSATSSKGAQGLMQLMPYTADYLSVEDAYDPEQNIFGGTQYISMLMERFENDTQLVLAAYNAGPENVDKYKGVPPFKETKEFIKKVMSYYDQYRNTGK